MPGHTTHDLTFCATTVVKRYSRWDRGEPAREWAALTLVHQRLPELVPEPLACDLGETAPSVTMSRLPGTPIGRDDAASDACLDAMASAMTGFHEALPRSELADLQGRRWDAVTGISDTRAWAGTEAAARRPSGPDEPGPSRLALGAVDTGLSWIQRLPVEFSGPPDRPVFARADGNIANMLWDGSRVRLVDFEDAGVSDLTYELADTVEHLSVWLDAGIDAARLLERFDLSAGDRARLTEYRRLFAFFWLLMLLPGNPADRRNPPGTCDRQAQRLLALL